MSTTLLRIPAAAVAGPSRLSSSESIVSNPPAHFNFLEAQALRQDHLSSQNEAFDTASTFVQTVTNNMQGVQQHRDGQVDHILVRSPSPRSSHPAPRPPEVLVISDSEDEVQVVEHPHRRTPAEAAAATLQDLLDTPNPWLDVADARITSAPGRLSRIRPQPARYGNNLSSVSTTASDVAYSGPSLLGRITTNPSSEPLVRYTSPWTYDDIVFHEPFFDSSWDPSPTSGREGRSSLTRRRSASSSPEPAATSTLTTAERVEALRQRRLELHLHHRNLSGALTREFPTASSSTPPPNFASLARGQRSAHPPSHDSARPRIERRPPSRLSATRSSSGNHNPHAPMETSEQRRYSLVMESMLHNHPEMLRHTRSSRRAGSSPFTRSASVERSSQSPSVQAQVSAPNSSRSPTVAPIRSRTPRPRALPLFMNATQSLDTNASPASSSPSSSNSQTARSNADPQAESASSPLTPASVASSAHLSSVPTVASPLRYAYPVTNAASSATTASDVRAGSGVNLRDVTLQVENLSTALSQVVATSTTSNSVRDAARRLISSGRALIRAVDNQDAPISAGEVSLGHHTVDSDRMEVDGGSRDHSGE